MARLFEFTNEFRFGIEDVDKEHEVLVNTLNDIYELLGQGKREEAFDLLSKNLVDYVNTHFADEEKFMESIGYPDLEAHKKVHENFKNLVIQEIGALSDGDNNKFRNMLAETVGWLFNHIGRTDRKYAEFYFSKN